MDGQERSAANDHPHGKTKLQGTPCRHVDDPPAVAEAFGKAWPTLAALLDRFQSNPEAMERITRAPRYAMRRTGKSGAVLLPLLLTSLPDHFARIQHSCLLYVASELIKVFGDDPSQNAALGASPPPLKFALQDLLTLTCHDTDRTQIEQ